MAPARPRSPLHRMLELAERERRFLVSEMVQVKGLMPLLMKPRNQMHWTREDRQELRMHLKRLSRLSPYVVALVMPGGFVMLPLFAWWVDRRRLRKQLPPEAVPRRRDQDAAD